MSVVEKMIEESKNKGKFLVELMKYLKREFSIQYLTISDTFVLLVCANTAEYMEGKLTEKEYREELEKVKSLCLENIQNSIEKNSLKFDEVAKGIINSYQKLRTLPGSAYEFPDELKKSTRKEVYVA